MSTHVFTTKHYNIRNKLGTYFYCFEFSPLVKKINLHILLLIKKTVALEISRLTGVGYGRHVTNIACGITDNFCHSVRKLN